MGSPRTTLATLARAGLLTALTDGAFAIVLSVAVYHSTVTRLFQGVASTLLGAEALTGGTRTAVIGVLMHIGVAFGWSAVFLFFVVPVSWVRALMESRYGVLKVAALFGPMVWATMSLVVIPLLVHRPPVIGLRWWIQFVGHAFFVGLPIVATVRAGRRGSPESPVWPDERLQP